jgi:hypothetical protein
MLRIIQNPQIQNAASLIGKVDALGAVNGY